MFHSNNKIPLQENISVQDKLTCALVNHVYSQTFLALIASLFCAAIVFVAIYPTLKNTPELLIWSIFFLIISAIRIMTIFQFYRHSQMPAFIKNAKRTYILGSLAGGISWGLIALLFFNQLNNYELALILFMLAGVTAGAVPLASAIPEAGISFLMCALLPYIVIIAHTHYDILLLFDLAMMIYLFYSIAIILKSYTLIKNSFLLTYENDALLQTLKITNKKLMEAATLDPLTRIANRRLFFAKLNDALISVENSQTQLALLFIDIDHFKKINDQYGHHVGDHLLLTLVERMRHYFGNDDAISRLGGDEFTVILKNFYHIKSVALVAQELCQLIRTPLIINDHEFFVTVSIGISLFPHDAKDAPSLIRIADKLMYEVKHQGKNNYSFSQKCQHYLNEKMLDKN